MTKILWFTGLSGSGKSAITEILKNQLTKLQKTFKIFDGDIVREKLHKHLGFSRKDILENNRLISDLCAQENTKVDFILVPIISPFKESRNAARSIFGKNFVEIFINCPYSECKKRDVKGLYKKAENNEIENFIGLHIQYEKPLNPEIILNTVNETKEKSANKILSFLKLKNL